MYPSPVYRAMLGRSIDRNVQLWAAGQIANGGKMPSQRWLTAVSDFWRREEVSGRVACISDVVIYRTTAGTVAQMAAMGLTSLKLRLLGTSMNSTPVTPNGLVGGAAALTRYAKTAFVPLTHGTTTDGTKQWVYTYETLNANSGAVVGCYVDASKNVYHRPRANGRYSSGLNSTITDGTTTANSIGGTAYSRDGTTFTYYKDGVSVGTVSPATTGAVLPAIELYALADNVAGAPEAGSYRQTNLQLLAVGCGVAFTDAQHLGFHQSVSRLMAALDAALPAADVYVSSVSYGGIPIGVDATADATAAAPFLTWDAAYAYARPGDRILLNGNPASPPVYQSTTATILDKRITVKAINSRGAILAGVGSSRAVLVQPAAGETITIDGVIIDASQNSGGTAGANCLQLTSQTLLYTLNLIDVMLQGWAGATASYSIRTSAANCLIALTITNCSQTGGTDTLGGIQVDTLGAGSSVVINGGTHNVPHCKAASRGPIFVGATATGVTASVSNTTCTMHADDSLTGGGIHYGIYIQNIASAIIDTNNVTVTATAGTRSAVGIYLTTSQSGTATELPCDGGIVRTNTVYNDCVGGGGLIIIGSDGSGDKTKCLSLIARSNTGSGSAAAISAGLHGIEMGTTTDGLAELNTITATALALVSKLALRNIWQDNTLSDATSAVMLAKGDVNSIFRRNAITQHVGYAGTCFYAEDDTPGSGAHSTGVSVSSNTSTNAGAISLGYTKSDLLNTVTYANNVYNHSSGTENATDKFNNLTVSYATLAAWLAVEPTATGTTA